MTINWKHVEYANARRFWEIMKAWANEAGWTQADIKQQERIVAKCKAEFEAGSGDQHRTATACPPPLSA
jgi:hypothetical protein